MKLQHVILSLIVAALSLFFLPLAEGSSKGSRQILRAAGSATMKELMTRWLAEYCRKHNDVNYSVESRGSATAVTALIDESTNIGCMSRRMTSAEISQFVQEFGYEPTAIPLAIAPIAVFVHPSNPIDNITLQQLDAMFSTTHNREAAAIKSWIEVAPSQFESHPPINLYIRNSGSGTYSAFKQMVLLGGEYVKEAKPFTSPEALIDAVAKDPYGIGFSCMGVSTGSVKVIRVNGFDMSHENSATGNYPLSRILYIYINKPRETSLNPLVKDFVSYILSDEGQRIVDRAGFYRLPYGNLKLSRHMTL
jgi:phosphate transport system substrate-binding protein